MKHVFLISVLFVLSASPQAASYAHNSAETTFPYISDEMKTDPKSLILIFDIHKTLLYNDITRMILGSLKSIFLNGGWYYLGNPYFVGRLRQLVGEGKNAEHVFNILAEEYPGFKKFESHLFDLSNSQYPIEGMFELLQDLKKQGYTLYILTNTGENTYQDLAKKFPDLMALFAGAYASGADNEYAEKPQPQFYDRFITNVRGRGCSQCSFLLIDDKEENLVGGNNCEPRIDGLLFKGVTQLRSDLEQLNILTRPESD